MSRQHAKQGRSSLGQENTSWLGAILVVAADNSGTSWTRFVTISAKTSYRERFPRDAEPLQENRASLPVLVDDLYPDGVISEGEQTVEGASLITMPDGSHVHPSRALMMLPAASTSDQSPSAPGSIEEPSQDDGDLPVALSSDIKQGLPALRRRRLQRPTAGRSAEPGRSQGSYYIESTVKVSSRASGK